AQKIDSLGRSLSYNYDLAGRLVRFTNADGGITLFGYDLNGNMTTLQTPTGPLNQMAFNALDLLASYIPLSLMAAVASSFLFYLDKELLTETHGDSRSIQYSYDNGGRLTSAMGGQRSFSYLNIPGRPVPARITSSDKIVVDNTFVGSAPRNIAYQSLDSSI